MNKLATASERIFFIWLIFQFCAAKIFHGTVLTIERPARGRKILKIKKPPGFATRNGGNSTSRPETVWADWPHPSLCGEVGRNFSALTSANQTGILTSASNLTPAFPIFISGIGNL
jgi:hypothetical protein